VKYIQAPFGRQVFAPEYRRIQQVIQLAKDAFISLFPEGNAAKWRAVNTTHMYSIHFVPLQALRHSSGKAFRFGSVGQIEY